MRIAHSKPAKPPATPRDNARERIDRTAYELFSRHGVRAVGVDRIIACSGVAKMTLFRHYPSKDSLVLSFLQRREELWLRTWLQGEVERRAGNARERLLAIFDVFDKWFRRGDFEGCSFIRLLLEFDDRAHPVRVAAVRHLEVIRDFLKRLAMDAGAIDADGLSRQWQILMQGSIVAAVKGDRNAAQRARRLGALLLASAARSTRGQAPARPRGRRTATASSA
ncbi:MAG TPA: TetR/AcrR family transcriptional regulator [Burkholderiaceae bacterium]|jgi:AcrR family transcriptional regulator|nr:TetR/AcrR family transcriptional regulator [Burkholderiaceae bacterium]